MIRYVEFNIDTLEWGEVFDTEHEAQENINLRTDAENWVVLESIQDGGLWFNNMIFTN